MATTNWDHKIGPRFISRFTRNKTGPRLYFIWDALHEKRVSNVLSMKMTDVIEEICRLNRGE